MLLQYMHKCSRRKSQDTVILSLATAPSLFLSFTIFWKELSSQNFISTSSLHLLLLPPQSTETHQTPTTPHPPTQISVLISLWCLMPLSTACSIPSSLEFLMIFLPCLWLLLRPLPALLPLPCSSLNSSCSSEFHLCRSLLTLGEFNCSQCCLYTKSVLIILKCRLLAQILL